MRRCGSASPRRAYFDCFLGCRFAGWFSGGGFAGGFNIIGSRWRSKLFFNGEVRVPRRADSRRSLLGGCSKDAVPGELGTVFGGGVSTLYRVGACWARLGWWR